MCYYFFDLYFLFRFVYYPANYIHWRCYCGYDDDSSNTFQFSFSYVAN